MGRLKVILVTVVFVVEPNSNDFLWIEYRRGRSRAGSSENYTSRNPLRMGGDCQREILDHGTNVPHSLVALMKKRNDTVDWRSESLGICDCGSLEINNKVIRCKHARADICSYKELD
jgi:hypothetical protein